MPRVNANITVGVEVECVRTFPAITQIAQHFNFERHLDHSIRGDAGETLPRTGAGAGTEIVTRPILVPIVMNGDGNALTANCASLDAQIRAITQCMAHVNSSCGIHIHLGRPSRGNPNQSDWGPDRVRTMLVVGHILEERLMGVVHSSRRNNHHCERIGTRYSKADMGQFYPVGRVDPIKYNNTKRYCWLNLIETVRTGNRTEPGHGGSPSPGTVEIRLLGETMDYEYIRAWTSYWVKVAALVAYAPSSLAVAHCCLSSTLEADFLALKFAYEADAKVRSSPPITSPPQRPSSRVNQSPLVSALSGDPHEIRIESTPITSQVRRRIRRGEVVDEALPPAPSADVSSPVTTVFGERQRQAIQRQAIEGSVQTDPVSVHERDRIYAATQPAPAPFN